MLIYSNKYRGYTDRQIIEALMKKPAEERFYQYFLHEKCAPILSFVSANIMHIEKQQDIYGEVYEFLSDNDWKVIRNYKEEHNTTLITYLSGCIVNHFRAVKRKENARARFEVDIETPDTYAEIMRRAEEPAENPMEKAVMRAYRLLKEKDRNVIKSLILDEMSSIEAADIVWPSIRSDCDWRDLPRKRVQDTISMKKHRTILLLYFKLNEILKEEQN